MFFCLPFDCSSLHSTCIHRGVGNIFAVGCRICIPPSLPSSQKNKGAKRIANTFFLQGRGNIITPFIILHKIGQSLPSKELIIWVCVCFCLCVYLFVRVCLSGKCVCVFVCLYVCLSVCLFVLVFLK